MGLCRPLLLVEGRAVAGLDDSSWTVGGKATESFEGPIFEVIREPLVDEPEVDLFKIPAGLGGVCGPAEFTDCGPEAPAVGFEGLLGLVAAAVLLLPLTEFPASTSLMMVQAH